MRIKRILIALLACCLVFAYTDIQAQNRSGKGTPPAKTKGNKGKKGKKGKPAEPEIPLVTLPYNSNDIIFAIPIEVDKPFGPTVAPQGAGRVMEVMADQKHPNLPEFEHNSVWYKFTVPYNGLLDIAVTQQDMADDYDMLVYRYTDVYFSNHVQCNKILPVAINMAAPDSALLAKPKKGTVVTTGDPAADKKAKAEAARKAREQAQLEAEKGTIGMYHDAEPIVLTKEQTDRHIRSIEVRKGEVYYIFLDKVNPSGAGHTIKVSIHVDAFEIPVSFYDPKIRKNVDVNLIILEKNTNRKIVENEHFKTGRVKFVPTFNYTLYAKKEGYFSVFLDFNSDRFKEDTLMRIPMNRAERGTVYPIKDIYFTDESKLMNEESDSILMTYVQMFKNHPDVTFLVKGFVKTWGIDIEHDQLVSLERAKSVKEFFVKNGIPEDHIRTAGMTPTEIKRAATAAFDPKKDDEEIKIQLVIISIGSKENP